MLFLPQWAEFLIHGWVWIPQLLASIAGTVGGGWTLIDVRNRLVAILAGVVAGHPTTGLFFYLGGYLESPYLIWSIVILAPLLGATLAYLASRHVHRMLRQRASAAS